MVRDVFQQRLAEVEREIQELQQLRQRMTTALAAWQEMPDGTPDGHTICRLIEHWEDPAPAEETGGQNDGRSQIDDRREER